MPFVLVEAAQRLIEEEREAPVNLLYKRFPLAKIEIGPGMLDPYAAKSGLKTALAVHKFDIGVEIVESPFR